MNLLDRITLLRAGYSRKEIDQMIEEEAKQPDPLPADPEPEDPEDPEPEDPADPEPEDPEDPEPEDKTDYKALFEQERKAKEALQKQNRDRDRSDPKKKSDVDIVKDMVSSFF